MPRTSTERKVFKINDPDIMSYFGGNGTATTEYMKKRKSELSNKDVKTEKDEKVIKWIDSEFDRIHNPEDAAKKLSMDTEGPGTKRSLDGTNSNYSKNIDKEKDDNANPTGIGGVPRVSTNSREIMSNNPTSESIDTEIDSAKYLIEYMNNKNKQL